MLRVPIKEYLLEPVKLVVIPVTTQRVYVYHKHRDDMLSKSSMAIRAEFWLSRKSESLWNKMVRSPKPINQKIVSWVRTLLDDTPWMEDSLKSVPGEKYLFKTVIKKSPDGQEKVEKLTADQFKQSATLKAKPLPVYYPSGVLSPDHLSSILQNFYTRGLQYHKKQTIWCLLGLPLTIPVILIPIIPNVPGFYLCYRAYCNYKAYLGARHMQTLHKHHRLQLRDLEGYSELFDGKRPVQGKEQLLLDTNVMKRILDRLEVHEIEPDLEKVIRQERERLGV